MKPASRAPMYAAIYHGLAEIARAHGYALSIHGSLQTDLDLVAIPWVDDAGPAEELVKALYDHCGACLPATKEREIHSPEVKPHGRRAWNLYMIAGAKVDVSVVPRIETHKDVAHE